MRKCRVSSRSAAAATMPQRSRTAAALNSAAASFAVASLAERAPLLAVVDDQPDSALLRGLDTDFDPVHEVGAAGADVRAKDIRAVALVMDAAGGHRAGLGNPLDLAKDIDRRAADRRQEDLEIGPGDELGEHAPG